MKKLPKKFKANWLKALRSGGYKHSEENRLFDGECYCVLAVGLKVLGITDRQLEGNFLPVKRHFPTLPEYFDNDIGCVEEWQGDLINMNTKKTFKQMANWIEKNL